MILVLIYVVWKGFNDMHKDFYITHVELIESFEKFNQRLDRIFEYLEKNKHILTENERHKYG